MNTPSYNTEACKKLSLKQFKEIVGWVEYFKNLTESQWQAEYLTATGFDANYFSNNTVEVAQDSISENKPVVVKNKPQRKRG